MVSGAVLVELIVPCYPEAATALNATSISVATFTQNKGSARHPEVHFSNKGNQRYFGMKVHIGSDADSWQAHLMRGTADHSSDIAEAHTSLRGEETRAFDSACCQAVQKTC